MLVKYSLLKMPLVGYVLRNIDAIPMYRKKDGVDTRQNASSFEAIDNALLEGAVIAIFPEGESLNSHRLRPLKSGMARMLLSAYEASNSTLNPVVVPIGVTYEDRDRFRSLASAVIGEPFEVVPIIERAGSEFRVAIRAIMKESRGRLEELTIQADSEEEWSAAVGLERILPRSSAPIGIRQMEALQALRKDTGEGAERRREIIDQLGDSLRRARLSGDEILAPAPSLVGVALSPRLEPAAHPLARGVGPPSAHLRTRLGPRADARQGRDRPPARQLRARANPVVDRHDSPRFHCRPPRRRRLARGNGAERRHVHVVLRHRSCRDHPLAQAGDCPILRGNRVDPVGASLDSRSVRCRLLS